MTRLLERAGAYLPAAIALALPTVFAVPGVLSLGDLFILPRASIVIAGACLGIGLALLSPVRNDLGSLRRPLVAAAVAALLAFVFSVNWGLSFAGSYSRYESLPVRLSYLGLLAAAAWLLRTERQRAVLIAAFVFGCSVASAEAVQQWYSHAPFRPDGNLGNANLLAALLVMAIPLAADGARRAKDFWIAPWAGAIVAMLEGLYVTTSRSGGLGLVVGLVVLAVFYTPRRFVIPASAIGAVAVAGAVRIVQVYLNRLNDDPGELRLGLWRDGLHLVAARPLTGWGDDTTGLVFGHYLSQDYATLVTFDRIHSGPLDLAATQGILGLATTGLVLAIVGVHAWRRRDEPMVAGLAAALAGYTVWVFFNFDWAPATGAFWLLAGALWSATRPVSVAASAPAAAAPWRQALAFALAIAVLPLAVFPLLADAWYVAGRADLAVRVDPLQAQYHWSVNTIAELNRAAELGETEPGMYVELGDFERQKGDLAAARRAYRRALEIDPYYTPASDRLAELGA